MAVEKIKGFFILDHETTGKRLIGVSADAANEVRAIADRLTTASCENKAMQELYNKDSKVKLSVKPFNSLKDARKFEKEYRNEHHDYLILN